MEPDSGLYDAVVSTYILVIKQDSPEAAAAIEEIVAVCGSRAALRATLVITLLKMEVQKSRSIEDMNTHSYVIKDYPEALPFLERAIQCLVQGWGIAPVGSLGLANGNPTSADSEPPPSVPIPPPV